MPLAIPDDLLLATKMSAQELRVEIALMLYQQDKLTLGQASTLAEMPQLRFQHLLAARGIKMHYDLPEFEEDLATLQRLDRL